MKKCVKFKTKVDYRAQRRIKTVNDMQPVFSRSDLVLILFLILETFEREWEKNLCNEISLHH